jgi:cephalosporin-C deacetylase-like acetyl esterase
LVFDPIDQGEREQLIIPNTPPIHSTTAHTNVGMSCILLGRNTARFEIWDGMRAIDFLQSRPEVDPKLIGCTGCSGGGTQTSYLMALDDRIGCAAPSCYITSISKLMHTEGPQDAEQNIFGQLAFGMGHADYIMMRATSPVLLLTATNDFFNIEGAWDSFRYAKRLYTRLGVPERVSLLEVDDKHGYSVTHHEGAGRWMSRWLLGKDQMLTQGEITLLNEQEYRCAPDGKVMNMPGARSVYDLNDDYAKELAQQRETLWKTGDHASLLEKVRQIAGVRKLADLPKPQVESVGEVAKTGYRVEKLVIKPEEGVVLPALLFLPEKPKAGSVVLYLNQQGKSADAGENGPIEQLVKAGNTVLAVDIRGTGQTQAGTKKNGYSDEFRDAYLAYLLGKSFVGMRTEDVLACARYATERAAEGHDGAVQLVAVGNVGIAALHAAALEPQLFQNVKISKMLASWSHVIQHRLNNQGIVTHVVHGALTHYDLPNLASLLGDKITIEHPFNAQGEPMEK